MTKQSTEYVIERPPLAASYDLPTRQRLLEVQPGDQVKICLCVTEQTGERMWVEVIECCHPRRWRGILYSQPHHIDSLKFEDDITFHPLDVIDVCRFSDVKYTDDDDASNMQTLHEFCNVVTDRCSVEPEQVRASDDDVLRNCRSKEQEHDRN